MPWTLPPGVVNGQARGAALLRQQQPTQPHAPCARRNRAGRGSQRPGRSIRIYHGETRTQASRSLPTAAKFLPFLRLSLLLKHPYVFLGQLVAMVLKSGNFIAQQIHEDA